MEKRYWLIKSEPDCYSIDDLARDGKDPWAGVRNYQARNYMRDEMRQGDKVLYYHSSTTPPGVIGLAEVASPAYPDATQFDASSEYYDATSAPDKPRWFLVDMAFVEKFPRLVTLDELKADPALEGMEVARRGNRLSITRVSEAHFKRVVSMAKDAE